MYQIKNQIYQDMTKTQKSALCNFLRALVKKSPEMSVADIFDKFIERSVPLFTKPVRDLWNVVETVEDLPFRDQPIVGHGNVDVEIIRFVNDSVMEMPVDVEGLVSDRDRFMAEEDAFT